MMKYTLAQIYGALGAVENGADLISSLQGIVANNQQQDKSGEILKKLGLNSVDEIDGIVSTLDLLKKSGGKPDVLASQVAELTAQVKDLTQKYTASENKAKEERDKRIKTNINTQLMSELTKGNALMPEVFSQVLAANIIAKDDDSLVYKNGDKEISIADGVKSWLEANPNAVKNTVQTGAGSNVEGGTGNNKLSNEQLGSMPMKDYIKYRTENKE